MTNESGDTLQEAGPSRDSISTIKAVVAVAAVAGALLLATGGDQVEGTLAGPPESMYEVDVDPATVAGIAHVTDEQMRVTLLGIAACTSAAGFETELAEFVPGLRWHFETDLGMDEDHDLAARASEALDACAASAAVMVDAYVAQNRLSPAEQAAFDNRIRACMAERGISVASEESPALAGGAEAGTAFHDCQAEVFQRPGE